MTPGRPLQRNFRATLLPRSLANHLERAWQIVAAAVDAARARLRLHDGIPCIEFGEAYEPLTVDRFVSGDHLGHSIEVWALPRWVSFHPDDFLIRQALLQDSDGQTYWLVTVSHLVCDGRSLDLLYAELVRVIHCLARGEMPVVRSFPSLAQSMAAEREQDDARQDIVAEQAMAQRIDGLKTQFSVFGVRIPPGDDSKIRGFEIFSRELTRDLISLAASPDWLFRTVDVTLSNMLTAIMAVWVFKHGGTRSFVIGIPHHGRISAQMDLVGFKSRMLPFCVEIDPEVRFSELVQAVHREGKERMQDIGVSIANPPYSPNYHVSSNYMFLVNPVEPPPEPLVRVEIPEPAGDPETVYAIWTPCSDDPERLRVGLGLKWPLMQYTDMDRIRSALRTTLESLTHNPELTVREMSFIDPESALFFRRMETPRIEDVGVTWLTQWIEGMSRYGHEPALELGEETLTHAELHNQATRWLTCLQTHGVKPGEPVVVWSASSGTLAAAYLAIVSCGAVYVPIHADRSIDQVADSCADLGAKLVLCTPGCEPGLPTEALSFQPLDALLVADFAAGTLLDPDADASAHIFHTSGSTGIAKPIHVSHRALAASIHSWIESTGMQPGERIFHFYATTFDPWLTGLLPTLWLGGACVIHDGVLPPSATQLLEVLRRHRISTLCTPTAYFHVLCDLRLPTHVMRWIVGGEALAADKAHRFLGTDTNARSDRPSNTPANTSATRLINAYGPTETTIWVSALTVTEQHTGAIPIGRPFATGGFRVADASGCATPFGVPGELWITGPQVGIGYWGQPELTARHFVERDGRRWYRTGDMVRWRKDGDLDFLGRLDRQVQVRGYRVEPGEIEQTLRALPDIADAVVVPRQLDTTTSLCAYVVLRDPSIEFLPHVMRSQLLRTMPEYKVPKWFVAVPAFPLNTNGKIDTSRLPAPNLDANQSQIIQLPSLTLWDLKLAFESVLSIENVGIDDDFFGLGGDSLQLVQLLATIKQRFNQDIDATQVIRHPTIGGLAPHLDTVLTGRSELVATLRSGRRAPLFCIPGAGGIGVEFYPISRHLPPDQPVLVLRSSGTDGQNLPPRTLSALLEEHVQQIITHRGQHVVHLAGYSLGGNLVYETAHRLKALGIPVGELFILDSLAATSAGRALLLQPARPLSQRIKRWFRHDSGSRESAALALELKRAIAARRRMNPADLGRYNFIVQASMFKEINARPGQFSATYFLASDGEHAPHARIWASLIRDLDIVAVSGEHQGANALVRDPHAVKIADVIAEKLQKHRNAGVG